jgi:hypothetical protein
MSDAISTLADQLSALANKLAEAPPDENSHAVLVDAVLVDAGKAIWDAYRDGLLKEDPVWDFVVQKELGETGTLADGDEGFAGLAWYSISQIVPTMLPHFDIETAVGVDDCQLVIGGLVQLVIRLRGAKKTPSALVPIEWSKMVMKGELRAKLRLSANTLKKRLTESEIPVCGMIRYRGLKRGKKIQIAIADAPSELRQWLQGRVGTNIKR